MKHHNLFTTIVFFLLFIPYYLHSQHSFSVGLDNMYLNDEYRIYDSNPNIYNFEDFNEEYLFSGLELGYHFTSKKDIYFRLNSSFYWKSYAKDKIVTFSNFLHANKIKLQSGKYIGIKNHSLGLGGEFYIFNSGHLNWDYGVGPIIDYMIPLKDQFNVRIYGSYAFDLNDVCMACDESLPRSYAYHFGILIDFNFGKKASNL